MKNAPSVPAARAMPMTRMIMSRRTSRAAATITEAKPLSRNDRPRFSFGKSRYPYLK